MNWLHYLIEANIYLAVFYACYCLFLNKETYYTLNRAYLLLSCIISFILPVVQIGALKPAANLPEFTAVSYSAPVQNAHVISLPVPQPSVVHQITWDDALWAIYIVGIAVLALLLFIKLFRLINLTTSGKTLIDNKYKLIDVEDTDTAFSFFNYLFIGTKTTGNDIIIQHELVHIRQKHSVDIVFIEVIKIINWFNPVIYLLQISLKTVHEYIADEQTAALDHDALAYSTFLVDNAYGLNGSSITHSFFNYNLLKKRIIMLNQKRSGRLARLKYLVAIPVFGAMLCASTLAFSKNYALIDLAPKHKTVAVVGAKTAKAPADTVRTRINAKATTAKGYKYEETGYLINNKTDYRVIITDKNGEQKEYYKSKANASELAMLQEKYGYKFPKMMIYPKLPPPPPMPPGAAPLKSLHKLPPPPPAPPVASADIKNMPPPPPPIAPKRLKGLKNMPPPAAPVVSGDVKSPPPPPAPPIGAVGLPLPPLPPVKLKKSTKWVSAVAPSLGVKPVSPAAVVAPVEPATVSPDVKAVTPTAPNIHN